MGIRSKTIFSSSSLPTTEGIETKKTSYWLEKLFKQERDRRKENHTEVNASKSIPTDKKIVQSLEEKGTAEALKSHANKAERNRQAVEDMVNNSNRILLKISSVFPWDFFQNTIVVEETRITITHRQLFSSQVYSVDIKNISNIFIESGILFAQLKVVSDTFSQNQIVINKLWKKDAIFMRRIIEGLRMFISHDIDTTDYEVKELLSKLKELSTTEMDQ